jgi:hypothetical protein
MTLYQKILWTFVKIRVLEQQPREPSPRENLFCYAVSLELQYSRICSRLGQARRRDASDTARQIVDLLGLTTAAEPLPRYLLVLLQRHHSRGDRTLN